MFEYPDGATPIDEDEKQGLLIALPPKNRPNIK